MASDLPRGAAKAGATAAFVEDRRVAEKWSSLAQVMPSAEGFPPNNEEERLAVVVCRRKVSFYNHGYMCRFCGSLFTGGQQKIRAHVTGEAHGRRSSIRVAAACTKPDPELKARWLQELHAKQAEYQAAIVAEDEPKHPASTPPEAEAEVEAEAEGAAGLPGGKRRRQALAPTGLLDQPGSYLIAHLSGRHAGAKCHQQEVGAMPWVSATAGHSSSGATAAPPTEVLIINCKVLNCARAYDAAVGRYVASATCVSGAVHVRGRRVVAIYPLNQPEMPPPGPLTVYDAGGRFLLPGLCDAHVHVTANVTNLGSMVDQPTSLVAARGARILEGMLLRGFTTVRDAGGADHGLAAALKEGTILGPRLLFCGKALSQTGGHGDFRQRSHHWAPVCNCANSNSTIGRVVNGPTQVREAVRDELRKGASHIKIMASGGVASPTDKITSLQFSEEEIAAAVDEAAAAGSYVMAHAYTPAAVRRCLRLGVRSIEHGNLMDAAALDDLVERDAYLVPTLITYKHLGTLPPDQAAKVGNMVEEGLRVLKAADARGARIAYGSDLLGSNHKHQLDGLLLHATVQSPAAVLAAATSTCAELFQLQGQVGTVAAGAFADLLLVEGNPLADGLAFLSDPGALTMLMKEGKVVRTTLPELTRAALNAYPGAWLVAADAAAGTSSGGGGGGDNAAATAVGGL